MLKEQQLANLKEQLTQQQTHIDSQTSQQALSDRLYLKQLQTQVKHIPLIHIDPKAAESHTELARVYTALMTVNSDRLPQIAPNEREKPKPISALEQLNRHKRLVILGDPGSGKSTFIDFVTLCMAGALLNDPYTNLALLQTPLPPDDDGSQRNQDEAPQPQPWDHGALFPLKIVLRKFATEGLPPPGEAATYKHLWDYVGQQLQQADLADYTPQLKQQFLEKGGLILFDGLDEVPHPEEQGPQLKQVIETLAGCYDQCHIVVTSRPYAYQTKAWQLTGFTQTTLAPFNQAQISQFINYWYSYLAHIHHWDEAGRQHQVNHLQSAIFNRHTQLKSLAETPLLLTLMVNLHASRGTLPEKRAELYEETVLLLLDHWERRLVSMDGQTVISPNLSDWLEVSQKDIRALLQQLAYSAHASQPEQAEGTASLDSGALLHGLMTLSRRQDIKDWELLDYLDQRAGVLVSQGGPVYRFPHRTFQEYLAACYLTEQDEFPTETARLVREDTNRWREVALLAGAKAAQGTKMALWLLVDELCPCPINEGTLTPPYFMSALLAGQAIIETADLRNQSKIKTQRIKRVQNWLTYITKHGPLPAREQITAGQLLGQLADNRLGVC